MKYYFHSFWARCFIYFVPLILILLLSTQNLFSADVTLAWDPNSEENLAGYRIFCRQESQNYNYNYSAWEGDKDETTCTIANLNDNTTYCFVARAYDEADNESVDSDEVCWAPSSNLSPSMPTPSSNLSPSMPTPSSNLSPSMPTITSPYYGQMECDVLLHITTVPFDDGYLHGQSRWQISKQEDFSSLILDLTSTKHLTELTVPHMVLSTNTTYFVRVQFYDDYSEPSDWSETIEFTTTSDTNDLDGNGVPDYQEVGYDIDLNKDGIADNYQPEVIKSVFSSVDNATIGVCKLSDSINVIEAVGTIDPSTISDEINKPEKFLLGLFTYRLKVNEPGATAIVRVFFSKDISTAWIFYKYDTINGWQDYSEHTTFNKDGQSLNIEVKDGGYGDSDGVANSVIVDPAGLAMASSSNYETSDGTGSSGGGGGGGGCFIATAAFGSYAEPHVRLLRDFRDKCLLTNSPGKWFVSMYYRYGPFWANFINIHTWCKPIIRLALMPLVCISHIMVNTSVGSTLITVIFFFVALMLACSPKLHVITRLWKHKLKKG